MFDLAMIGTTEWIWIAVILVLLFGARKLPELARSMGTSITAFKKGLKDENDGGQIADGSGEAKKEPSDS